MWNKTIALILAFCLAFLPTIVLAEEAIVPPKGKITGLDAGEPAPYSGVLLNSTAAASLLTNKDFLEKQWELKLEYELAKQSANLNLTIESQKVSYQALQQKHTTIINIKNKEIERLSEIAANKKDYTSFWAAGGVLVGIGLSIAVVYSLKHATN